MTVGGTSSFHNNYGTGLSIGSSGNITTSNLTANQNGQAGVTLDNSSGTRGSIALNGSNSFLDDTLDGLHMKAKGQHPRQ